MAAAVLRRSAGLVARSTRSLTVARALKADQAPAVDPALRKTIIETADPATVEHGVEGRIPDNWEQATGMERKEMIEMAKGNSDPFGLEGLKWGPVGTKESPRMIPSHVDERIVGCVVDPESEVITYFNLKAGPPVMGPDGQWFQLQKTEEEISW